MVSWKEGIDWFNWNINDPETIPVKSGHFFVSAYFGSDDSGDGSPNAPWRTINHARANSTEADTIVIKTGIYDEDLPTEALNRNIIGEGLVHIRGTNSELNWWYPGDSRLIKNVQFSRQHMVNQNSNDPLFEHCTFFDLRFNSNRSCSVRNSVFLNCYISHASNSINTSLKLENSIFKNCGLNYPSESSKGIIEACYLDASCILDYNHNQIEGSGVSQNNILGIYNKNGVYVNSDGLDGNISAPPLFNNEAGGGFSLKQNSPHKKLEIGFLGFGQAHYYQLGEQNWLQSIIDSSNNLSFNGNTGEIQVSTDTTVETPEFMESILRYAPILKMSGFPFVNEASVIGSRDILDLVYEMDWVRPDGMYSGIWKRFRFGEIPTLDHEGKSNGEEGFIWTTAEKIPLIRRKYRFTFLAGGLGTPN